MRSSFKGAEFICPVSGLRTSKVLLSFTWKSVSNRKPKSANMRRNTRSNSIFSSVPANTSRSRWLTNSPRVITRSVKGLV